MNSVTVGQAVDLLLRALFLVSVVATCIFGVGAAVEAIGSRRLRQLAELQEKQSRHKVAQIIFRRRLAEIVDREPAA